MVQWTCNGPNMLTSDLVAPPPTIQSSKKSSANSKDPWHLRHLVVPKKGHEQHKSLGWMLHEDGSKSQIQKLFRLHEFGPEHPFVPATCEALKTGSLSGGPVEPTETGWDKQEKGARIGWLNAKTWPMPMFSPVSNLDKYPSNPLQNKMSVQTYQSKITYVHSGLRVFIDKFVDPLAGFNDQHIIMVTCWPSFQLEERRLSGILRQKPTHQVLQV